MKKVISTLIKTVLVVGIAYGLFLFARGFYTVKRPVEIKEINPKVMNLKKFFTGFNRPARVEVIDLTEKFKADVDEIKKMKIPLDEKADFYIRIQFFTDETDESAPLVAQIRFIDIKSENLLKEESINLD